MGASNVYQINFWLPERGAVMVLYCDLFQLEAFTYSLSRNIKLKEIE